MTLLDAFKKAGLAVGDLKAALQRALDAAPDLAPMLQPILDGLDAPLTDANLLALTADLLPEASNILHGKLDPREHPGDAI